jgi:hypothetical protein
MSFSAAVWSVRYYSSQGWSDLRAPAFHAKRNSALTRRSSETGINSGINVGTRRRSSPDRSVPGRHSGQLSACASLDLITRRSWVQIPPPLLEGPGGRKSKGPFFMRETGPRARDHWLRPTDSAGAEGTAGVPRLVRSDPCAPMQKPLDRRRIVRTAGQLGKGRPWPTRSSLSSNWSQGERRPCSDTTSRSRPATQAETSSSSTS